MFLIGSFDPVFSAPNIPFSPIQPHASKQLTSNSLRVGPHEHVELLLISDGEYSRRDGVLAREIDQLQDGLVLGIHRFGECDWTVISSARGTREG